VFPPALSTLSTLSVHGGAVQGGAVQGGAAQGGAVQGGAAQGGAVSLVSKYYLFL
jgi:hypothetical protein